MSAGDVLPLDHLPLRRRSRCSWSGTGGATAATSSRGPAAPPSCSTAACSAGPARRSTTARWRRSAATSSGSCIPKSATNAIGIPEHTYRWFSAIAGGLAGAGGALVGFARARLPPRDERPRARHAPPGRTCVTTLLLTLLIVMGAWMTVRPQRCSTERRPTTTATRSAIWWRSLFYLQPHVAAVTAAPLIYQLHAIVAWALLGAVPVQPARARLEHPAAVHRPPYILYRRRYQTAR